jgi:hypothetical protein
VANASRRPNTPFSLPEIPASCSMRQRLCIVGQNPGNRFGHPDDSDRGASQSHERAPVPIAGLDKRSHARRGVSRLARRVVSKRVSAELDLLSPLCGDRYSARKWLTMER